MELDDILCPGGVLEKALPFYSYRESQYEMASVVETAFREEKIAILEAGTGIGKSFAYLCLHRFCFIFGACYEHCRY